MLFFNICVIFIFFGNVLSGKKTTNQKEHLFVFLFEEGRGGGWAGVHVNKKKVMFFIVIMSDFS